MSSAPTTPIEAVPAVKIPTPHPQPSGASFGRPATPTTPMPPASPPSASSARKKRRSGVLVGAVIVLLLGGIGGGGYYYLEVMGGSVPFLSEQPNASAATQDAGSSEQPPSTSRSVDPVTASQPAATESDSQRTIATQSTIDSAPTLNAAAQPVADSTPVAPAPPVAPPVPQQGQLVLSNLGAGATLFVDGRNVRGLQHTLDPGPHQIRVQRGGFEEYRAEVRIRAGETTRHRVVMAQRAAQPRNEVTPPASQCELPGPSYNRNGECFDVLPRPREATLVPLTAEIEGTPTPAILAIKVDAQGDVQQVDVAQRSGDDRFTILAVQFAKDLKFVPAQKNGRPIVAWTRVPFLPAPRQ